VRVMDRERDRDPGRGTHTQREEVFERIPWETLERPARDNNRMVMAVAGALVLGALGFSFVRNQPVSQPVVAPPTTIPSQSSPATVQPPVLRSEADLYAVDPDQIARRAASHAEWFVVEYLSFDAAATLESLLPVGVPAPRAPEGTRVYVDWVSAISVSDIGGLVYEVEVLARSMAAAPGEGFTRQAPVKVVVDVLVGTDGLPRVLRPPRFVDPVNT